MTQAESHARKHEADDEATRAAERIYKLWDEALGDKDVEAALALYARTSSSNRLWFVI